MSVESPLVSQYWASFCKGIHTLVATSSKYQGTSGSVLLFVGDSQLSMHTLALQLGMEPSSLKKVVEYLEETCLPNLIQLFEGFRCYLTEHGEAEFVEVLKKIMLDCGYEKVGDMNISQPSKDVEEDTEVVNIGVKSYLEEVISMPSDVVVNIVKQEFDACSQNDTSDEDNDNIRNDHEHIEPNKHHTDSDSSPKYHCQVCYRPFHRLRALQLHKSKKHKMGEDPKFKCQLCGHGFHMLPSLTTHIRRKHPWKKKNLCQYCGKYFEDSLECRKHIKWHLAERRNSRSVVKRKGRDSQSMKQTFHCEVCNSKFPLIGRLQNHIIRNHYDEMDSICLYCGKYFEDRLKCQSHVCHHSQRGRKQSKSLRQGKKRSQYKKHVEYKCELCDSLFLRRDALQTHIIETHYADKDRMCGHCGKLFDKVSECREHVLNHYKDRQEAQKDISKNSEERNEISKESFKTSSINSDPSINPNVELHCHLCNRRFYTLCSLQRHILRNHHDEKDRLCRYCGQCFESEDICSNHVRIHIAENRQSRKIHKQPIGLVNGKYSCQLCGRTFRLAATLRCHRLRAHPLEKERLCPRCGKYFDTEEACIRHRRLHVEKNHSKLGKNRARTISNIITGPKHIKCHLCGENFYVRGGIGNHIQRKHTAERRCLCRYCGKYFQTPDECRTHVRLHVIERREIRNSYREQVHPTFNQQSSHHENQESVTDASKGGNQEDTKPVKCQVCGREYKLLSSFRRHISQNHPDIQDRLCHHCGMLMEDSDACKQHLDTTHSHSQHKDKSDEDLLSQLDKEPILLPENDDMSIQGFSKDTLDHKSESFSKENSNIPPGYMKCSLCPSILGSRSSMRDHIKSKHRKVQEHMCACCGKFFEDPAECFKHQQPSKTVQLETDVSAIPQGYIKCGLCTSVLGSRKSMRDHIRSLHFKEKDHMCTCCGKYFSSTSERDQHQKPQVNLACDFCPRVFKTQFARDGHMKRHVNQRDFQCDICGNCYFDKKGLNAHRERHDSQATGMFQCSQCGKVLSSKKNLEIHMRIHNNERPFICEICGKGFTLVSTMKIHRNIHSGLKPYECEICGKKARTKGDLGRHMSLHSDKKEFVCDICGKSYRFQTGLNQHRAVHSGLRPHVCKLCGCTYKTSNDLRKHMKTHRPGAKSKGTTVPRVPVSAINSDNNSVPIYSNVPIPQPQPLPSQPHHQVLHHHPGEPMHQPSREHIMHQTSREHVHLTTREPIHPIPREPIHPPPREPIHVSPREPIHLPLREPIHSVLTHSSDNLASMTPHRTNTTYTNDDMAVVMALQVLDDISVAEQGAYGAAPQTMRRYDPNVASYPPPPTIRRYDGSITNYPNFRRYDGSAQNYP